MIHQGYTTVYYVTAPRWVRALRSVCESIIRWSKRFDTVTPVTRDGAPVVVTYADTKR